MLPFAGTVALPGVLRSFAIAATTSVLRGPYQTNSYGGLHVVLAKVLSEGRLAIRLVSMRNRKEES